MQSGDEAGTVLAEAFGITPQTVYKRCKRDGVTGGPFGSGLVAVRVGCGHGGDCAQVGHDPRDLGE